MVIAQLNLLLSLVNGVIDIGSIVQQKFKEQLVTFNPLTVMHFIKAMFKTQAQLTRTTISYQLMTPHQLRTALSIGRYDESIPES